MSMKHKCVWMNKRYVRILRIAFSVILRFTASDYVSSKFSYIMIARIICGTQGRIQDLKLGGAHLKKLRRPEWGAKIFGVFRVKNHDFTPKIIIFQFKAPPTPLDPPLGQIFVQANGWLHATFLIELFRNTSKAAHLHHFWKLYWFSLITCLCRVM
jgi:hypothetical protein